VSVRVNLLPDIRQQRLREVHRRQSATVIAVLIWVAVGGVTLLLALFNGTQKFRIADLSGKINDKKNQLSNISGLVDALTAQQHLASLPGLNGQKIFYTKFFTAYSALAPGDVALNSLSVDNTNLLKVSGTAQSYTSVAKLADALEAANVTVGPGANSNNDPYFTDVSVNQVSKGGTGQVSFNITAQVASGVTSGSK